MASGLAKEAIWINTVMLLFFSTIWLKPNLHSHTKMNGSFVWWRQFTVQVGNATKRNKHNSDSDQFMPKHSHMHTYTKHQWQRIINKIKASQRVSNTFTILQIERNQVTAFFSWCCWTVRYFPEYTLLELKKNKF